MRKLAVVRDKHLNPWDIGNYAGLHEFGVQVIACGSQVSQDTEDQIKATCPEVKIFDYEGQINRVFELGPDVIDVPDMHYWFSNYMVDRFERVIAVSWDNLPGKNDVAGKNILKPWKHVARSVMAASMLRFYSVKPENIRVIYGAVDTKMFAPDQFPEPVILFVGRLTLEKGLLDLAYAMKLMQEKARLIIVGDGDELLGDRSLINVIKRLGIEFAHFPSLGREDLARVYRLARVFCVPSIPIVAHNPNDNWVEQFGQVFPEALASGVPIATTSSGAIPEVVGLRNRIIPARSWDLLSMALDDIMRLPERDWLQWSRDNRVRAEENFSRHVIASEIRDWYFS